MAMYLKYKDQQFTVGDTVRVQVKIGEEDGKIQAQIFEGILMAIDNRQSNKMFRVRKIAVDGIGVERIFPASGPGVLSMELKRKGEARRAKLHYLRKRVGKEAVKVKERFVGEEPQKVEEIVEKKSKEVFKKVAVRKAK